MEEEITPFQFFRLDEYLQRKIMIEDLDYESIQNLCDAAKEMEQKRFLDNICENAEVWRAKFKHDFPRSFDRFNRMAVKIRKVDNVSYWKNFYRSLKTSMPDYEERMINAVKEEDPIKIEELLDLGVDPNITIDIDDKRTALMYASQKGNLEIVQALLNAGAYPNMKSKREFTALSFAAHEGYPEVVEALLAAGADINTQHDMGITPLMFASFYGKLPVVKILLDAGADVNIQNIDGNTALIDTTRGIYGNVEIIKELLNAGADVNARNKKGYTALMTAAWWGRHEMVEMLLRAGANINLQNGKGNTALMLVLKHYEPGVDAIWHTIWNIIKYNPNPNLVNENGETAIFIAKTQGLDSVVDALLYLRRTKETL